MSDTPQAPSGETPVAPTSPAPSPEAAEAQAQQNAAPMIVHAQYIKDMSFENPHAPDSLKPGQDAPQIGVNVGLRMEKIDDEGVYEVTLHIDARATRGAQVVFLAELDYAVVASVNPALPEKQHHPLLMIEAPKLAFPFARQVLAEITSQGGYPPVLLNPVDFEGLYIQQYQAQKQQQQAKKAAEG